MNSYMLYYKFLYVLANCLIRFSFTYCSKTDLYYDANIGVMP